MPAHLSQVTIVVPDYDAAIAFFVDVLGFELVEDSPATSDAGAPKRWVVVRPHGGETAILLARADGERQVAAIGNQTGGRVAFFLRVDDFDVTYERLSDSGVIFTREVRDDPYGRSTVFLDIVGNRWDLIGPPPVG